jgi:hypothetical protein
MHDFHSFIVDLLENIWDSDNTVLALGLWHFLPACGGYIQNTKRRQANWYLVQRSTLEVMFA